MSNVRAIATHIARAYKHAYHALMTEGAHAIRGFADLADDVLLTRREIAARLGYSRPDSLERALRRRGAAFPDATLGRRIYCGVVKAWVTTLAQVAATPQIDPATRSAGNEPHVNVVEISGVLARLRGL